MKLPNKDVYRYIKIGLVVILVGVIIFRWIDIYLDEKLIKSNYYITKGKIINYYKIGDIETPYIEYEYIVNKKYYKRTVIPKRRGDSLYTEFYKYNDQFYWVIYYKDNHQKSLINLNVNTTINDTNFPIERIGEFY